MLDWIRRRNRLPVQRRSAMKSRDRPGNAPTANIKAATPLPRRPMASARPPRYQGEVHERASEPREQSMDDLCVNTIRTLSMDAVQQANSGHPGTPMALAPLIYTLWQRFLRFDPGDPIWPNRDRFVLSNGHASMLLYAMLHLTGVKAINSEYQRSGE